MSTPSAYAWLFYALYSLKPRSFGRAYDQWKARLGIDGLLISLPMTAVVWVTILTGVNPIKGVAPAPLSIAAALVVVVAHWVLSPSGAELERAIHAIEALPPVRRSAGVRWAWAFVLLVVVWFICSFWALSEWAAARRAGGSLP